MKAIIIRAALTAALSGALIFGGAQAPASATQRANVSLQECINRHDFTEFFRNFSGTDKYCYDSGGPDTEIVIDLDHVTWFHAGNNYGYFVFLDRADYVWKQFFFSPGVDTGCTDCYVYSLYLVP